MFLFCTITLYSQTSTHFLKGEIKDNDGGFVSSAIVQLYLEDDFLSFQEVDEAGAFSFIELQVGNYTLKVNAFDYEEAVKEIVLLDDSFQEIRLASKTTYLEEIVVESPVFARVSKDTISYNVDLLRNGTERTLRDLIEKLPGLDIDALGSVSYQGKKLDNILINESEFYNDKHHMATKNILDVMVDEVSLIQNYQPNEVLKNYGTAGKTVLSIKLKEEYSHRVSAELEGGGGNNEVYKANANVFYFLPKGNIATINQINNIGENGLTLEDYMDVNKQIINSSGISTVSEATDIPVFLTESRNFRARKNSFNSANFSYKLNKKGVVNSYLIWDSNKTDQYQESFRDYGFNQITETQSIFEKPQLINAHVNVDYRLGSKNFLSYKAKTGFNKTPYSFVNSNQTTFESERDKNVVNQNVILYSELGKSLLGEFNVQTYWYRDSDASSFNSDLKHQTFKVDKHYYDVAYGVKKKKDAWQLDFKTQYIGKEERNSNLHNLNVERISLQEEEVYRESQFKNVLGFSYDVGKWIVKSGLEASYYDIVFGDKKMTTWKLNPSVALTYKLSNIKQLNVAYAKDNSVLSSDYLTQTSRMIDYQTILKGSLIDEVKLGKVHRFSFSYSDVRFEKGSFLFINGNYSSEENSVGTDNFVEQGFLYKQYYLAKKSNRISALVNYDKTFRFLPIGFKTKVWYSYAEENQLLNGEDNHKITNFFNTDFKATTNFKMSSVQLSYNFLFKFLGTSQKMLSDVDSRFFENTLGAVYTYNKLQIKPSFGWVKQQVLSSNNAYTTCNINVSYKLDKVAFFITGVNVLGMDSKSFVKNNVAPNYSGYDVKMTLPGYVLGGMRWNL